MSDLLIATEIKRQLFYFGQVKVWSWGANTWVGGENFLQFKVQGFKLKGTVRIKLNGSDLYDIEFKDKKGIIVNSINDVYAEDMVDIIDNAVETDNGKYLKSAENKSCNNCGSSNGRNNGSDEFHCNNCGHSESD